MAKLMATADLAIGAGGVASWERCCLAIPALLVSLAKNQIDIAKALDVAGACIYMGRMEAVNTATIQCTVTRLLDEKGQLEMLSNNAYALVDGIGVDRVLQKLGS
jgi:spore coat polysaccharide biosynthesis predicted glycosyltransferase SpsG